MYKFNVAITCVTCAKQTAIEVNWSAWQKYQKGALVQDAFPKMKPEHRELLISRICPDCWNKLWSDDDVNDFIRRENGEGIECLKCNSNTTSLKETRWCFDESPCMYNDDRDCKECAYYNM